MAPDLLIHWYCPTVARQSRHSRSCPCGVVQTGHFQLPLGMRRNPTHLVWKAASQQSQIKRLLSSLLLPMPHTLQCVPSR